MPDFRKSKESRPWTVGESEITKDAGGRNKLFRKWLLERGGVVVYQCQLMDSSHLGETAFMPARYIAVNDEIIDAPKRIGTHLVSTTKEQTDHVTLEDYDGDVEKAILAFTFEAPPAQVAAGPKKKRRKRGRG